ncbi:PhzF family phenazine biosynthesis protein [Pseudomonas sp. R2.Fl]|nr:PhzF family phenazine biosynthesis protein [Pseudomonas sp. R2.Fl]
MTERRFHTVDVFTATRFEGNPLAVILDTEGLGDDEMQAIATEFGYSETTFVLPPGDPANTAEVRIFTPTTEVPFAGHPNVGTAFVLGRLGEAFGQPLGDRLRFEEKAGLVEVTLVRRDGAVTGATIRAPGPLTVGSVIDPAQVAPCLGLPPESIVATRHRPAFVSVGLKFILVEVDGLGTLGKAAPDVTALGALRTAFAHENSDCAIFVYARVGEGHVRARMFAPFDNVPEDPATGSASAALGAFLASLDHFTGSRRLLVEQGVEMGRRSLIHVDVASRSGELESVFVTGECAEVMRGTL